eukprot:Hpha_TRINITY_DN16047_c1_g3::TRINITY_DN16047_c1_g3_i2::g.121165::m.121165
MASEVRRTAMIGGPFLSVLAFAPFLSEAFMLDDGRTLVPASGSTAMEGIVRNLHQIYAAERPSMFRHRYDGTGSAIGTLRVSRNESLYGLSDSPSIPSIPGLWHAPFALAPIAVIVHLTDSLGSGIAGVQLSRPAIAGIWSFDVLWWDDPVIVVSNPFIKLPHERIKVFVREEDSGTSLVFSKALINFGWATNPGCLLPGTKCMQTARMADINPGGGTYGLAQGSKGMFDAVAANRNSIGYVGVSSILDAKAHNVHLAVVSNVFGMPTVATPDNVDGNMAGISQMKYPFVSQSFISFWGLVNTAAKFVGVPEELRGLTRDYYLREGGEAMGTNWGYNASVKLHYPPPGCAAHFETLNFLFWVYTTDQATSVLTDHGARSVGHAAANRLIADMWRAECDGVRWASGEVIGVAVHSPEVEDLLNTLAFELTSELQLGTADNVASARMNPASDLPIEIWRTGDPDPPIDDDRLWLPFAATGLVFVHNPGIPGLRLPLNLRVSVLRRILSGKVTSWGHKDIAEGNAFVPLPNATIRMAVTRDLLKAALQLLGLSQSGGIIFSFASERDVAEFVVARTGFLGIVTPETAEAWFMSQVHPDMGAGPVAPTVDFLTDALGEAEFSPDFREVTFSSSPTAYPFVLTLWGVVPRALEESTHSRAIENLLQFLFNDGESSDPGNGAQKMSDFGASRFLSTNQAYVPLMSIASLRLRVADAIGSITIGGTPLKQPVAAEASEPNWTLIGTLIGAVVLIVLGAGAKVRIDSRRIRHLTDTNTIAEASAVAISEMRLEDMSYLRDTENPDRIESAFIKIMDSLLEYRRFLPQSIADGDGDSIAPDIKPPVGEVVLVFTDIQSSTMLWESAPDAMNQALTNHNRVMRKGAAQHNGYEVKTIGDAFMLAFPDSFDAMRFCLNAQQDLVNAVHPKAFERFDLTRTKRLGKAGKVIWRGLRVRMGAHVGVPTPERNPLTGRIDYRGPCVNMASRFESNGIGGGVAVSQELHKRLQRRKQDLFRGHFVSFLLGNKVMKGIKDAQEVWVYFMSGLEVRFETYKLAENPLANSNAKSRVPSDVNSPQATAASRERSPSRRSSGQSVDVIPMTPTRIRDDTTVLSGDSGASSAVGGHCLSSRDVTLVVLHPGASVVRATDYEAREVTDVLNVTVSAVVEGVGRTTGTLLAVTGGSIEIGWNATALCATHLLSSLNFFLIISQRMMNFSLGGCTGIALCGSIGSLSRKSTIATGLTQHLAAQQALRAAELGTPALMSDMLAGRHSSLFQYGIAVENWLAAKRELILVKPDCSLIRRVSRTDLWEASTGQSGCSEPLSENVQYFRILDGCGSTQLTPQYRDSPAGTLVDVDAGMPHPSVVMPTMPRSVGTDTLGTPKAQKVIHARSISSPCTPAVSSAVLPPVVRRVTGGSDPTNRTSTSTYSGLSSDFTNRVPTG